MLLEGECAAFNASDAAACGALADVPVSGSAPYELAPIVGSSCGLCDFVAGVLAMGDELPAAVQAAQPAAVQAAQPAAAAALACQQRNVSNRRECLTTASVWASRRRTSTSSTRASPLRSRRA